MRTAVPQQNSALRHDYTQDERKGDRNPTASADPATAELNYLQGNLAVAARSRAPTAHSIAEAVVVKCNQMALQNMQSGQNQAALSLLQQAHDVLLPHVRPSADGSPPNPDVFVGHSPLRASLLLATYNNWAALLRLTGDIAASSAMVQRAHGINPSHPTTLLNLAALEAQEPEHVGGALTHARQAMQQIQTQRDMIVQQVQGARSNPQLLAVLKDSTRLLAVANNTVAEIFALHPPEQSNVSAAEFHFTAAKELAQQELGATHSVAQTATAGLQRLLQYNGTAQQAREQIIPLQIESFKIGVPSQLLPILSSLGPGELGEGHSTHTPRLPMLGAHSPIASNNGRVLPLQQPVGVAGAAPSGRRPMRNSLDYGNLKQLEEAKLAELQQQRGPVSRLAPPTTTTTNKGRRAILEPTSKRGGAQRSPYLAGGISIGAPKPPMQPKSNNANTARRNQHRLNQPDPMKGGGGLQTQPPIQLQSVRAPTEVPPGLLHHLHVIPTAGVEKATTTGLAQQQHQAPQFNPMLSGGGVPHDGTIPTQMPPGFGAPRPRPPTTELTDRPPLRPYEALKDGLLLEDPATSVQYLSTSLDDLGSLSGGGSDSSPALGPLDVYDDLYEKTVLSESAAKDRRLSAMLTPAELALYRELQQESNQLLSNSGPAEPEEVLEDDVVYKERVEREAREREESERRKQAEAMRIIHAFARCKLGENVKQLRSIQNDKLNTHVNKIQGQVRMYLARKEKNKRKAAVSNKQRVAATIKIQRNWGVYAAKKELEKRRTARDAELLKDKQVHRRRVLSSVAIQSVWRSYHVRNMLEKQQSSAVKVQLWFRTYLVYKMVASIIGQRRHYRALEGRRQHAAHLIQAGWRAYVLRQEANAVRAILQSHREEYYALRDAQEEHNEAEQREELVASAAFVLQQGWRSYIVRKNLLHQYQEEHRKRKASLTIQCAYRQWASRNHRSANFGNRVHINLINKEAEHRHEAAIDIQKMYRQFRSKKAVKERKDLKGRQLRSVETIQRVFRGYQGKLHVKYLKDYLSYQRDLAMEDESRHQAAKIIQRLVRRFLRELRHKWQQKMNGTREVQAIKIQAIGRKYLARQRVHGLKFQHWKKTREQKHVALQEAAVIRLQSHFRKKLTQHQLNHKLVKRYLSDMDAASKIQRAYRRWVARKTRWQKAWIKQEKHRQASNAENLHYYAIVLQRNVRILLAKKWSKNIAPMKAARRIQRWWRSHAARNTVAQNLAKKDEKERARDIGELHNAAAETIQACCQSFITRQLIASNQLPIKPQPDQEEEERREEVEQHDDTPKQQGEEERRETNVPHIEQPTELSSSAQPSRKQIRNQAACTIQRGWRVHSARATVRRLRKERNNSIDSVITVEQHKAAETIGKCWKRYYRRKRRQAGVYPHTPPTPDQMPAYLKHLLVRCFFRESVVRYMNQLRGIETVQRFGRGYTIRRAMAVMKWHHNLFNDYNDWDVQELVAFTGATIIATVMDYIGNQAAARIQTAWWNNLAKSRAKILREQQLARKHHVGEEEEYEAANVIATNFKRHVAMKKLQRVKAAEQVLKRALLSNKAKHRAARLRNDTMMAYQSTIQNERIKAAATIQGGWRCKRNRNKHRIVDDERQKVRNAVRHDTDAASTIQRCWKQKEARRSVAFEAAKRETRYRDTELMQYLNHKATVIQCAYRRKAAMVDLYYNRIDRNTTRAMIPLQSEISAQMEAIIDYTSKQSEQHAKQLQQQLREELQYRDPSAAQLMDNSLDTSTDIQAAFAAFAQSQSSPPPTQPTVATTTTSFSFTPTLIDHNILGSNPVERLAALPVVPTKARPISGVGTGGGGGANRPYGSIHMDIQDLQDSGTMLISENVEYDDEAEPPTDGIEVPSNTPVPTFSFDGNSVNQWAPFHQQPSD